MKSKLIIILLILLSLTGYGQMSSARKLLLMGEPNIRFMSYGPYTSTTNTTSITIDYPTNVRSGDLLVLIVGTFGGGETVAPGADWTLLVKSEGGFYQTNLFTFWKICTTDLSGSLIVPTNSQSSGLMSHFKNPNVSPIVDVVDHPRDNVPVYSIAQTVDGVANSIGLGVWCSNANITSPSLTGSGWSSPQYFSSSSPANTIGVSLYYFSSTSTSLTLTGLNYTSYQAASLQTFK